MLLKILLFVVLSIGLIYISRGSLRSPRSHGFYRFFAWEIMLALFLLVVDGWFRDPWLWHQWISWLLLFGSLIPLTFGVRSLIQRGKPIGRRDGEPQLYAFENTSELVTDGIFHYIRHPLYSSLLLLTWGMFFKAPGWLGLLLAAAASGCLFATTLADEAECRRFFGEQYAVYMKRSKRFIPFVF